MTAPTAPPTTAELRDERSKAAWRVQLWEQRSEEAAKQLAEAREALTAADRALDAGAR